jgi:protoheme IX farnesyltransferase
MLKKYLFLTKPGILFGNFVTTLGGYFLAAQGSVDFLLLLITLLGTTLVVASGCVVNNVIDQDIDQKCSAHKIVRWLKNPFPFLSLWCIP